MNSFRDSEKQKEEPAPRVSFAERARGAARRGLRSETHPGEADRNVSMIFPGGLYLLRRIQVAEATCGRSDRSRPFGVPFPRGRNQRRSGCLGYAVGTRLGSWSGGALLR